MDRRFANRLLARFKLKTGHLRLDTWPRHLLQTVVLPIFVFTLSALGTYVLWQDARNRALQALEKDFEFHVAEARDRVVQRMNDYDQVLHGLRGLFAGSVSVNREEFHGFVTALDIPRRYPGIQGIGFVPWVPQDAKASHIARVRREGFPQYKIYPEGDREVYTPVEYIEPFSGENLRAFGYDIFSEPVRRAAMEHARDIDRATITGGLTLVQDANRQAGAGFLMLLPIYQNGMVHDTVLQRRTHLVGWVDAVFRAEQLMQGVLGKGADEIDIDIFDGDLITPSSLIYGSDKASRADHSKSMFSDKVKLEIAGRQWSLLVRSRPAFEARLEQEKARYIALGGVVFGILLALLTWILARSRLHSMQAAHIVGQELNARKQAEESLRLAAMVYEKSGEGMLVTDANNCIIAVNPAFSRITGYTLSDVEGRDLRYFNSGRHGTEFYEAMWKELDSTGCWQGEIWDKRKDGEIQAKYLTINSIYNEDNSVFRRVALFIDVSEKKETEEFIWRQANFDALTNLPNRSMFLDRLAQEVKKAHRAESIFALLFVDLDLFKEVNDTLGHHVGDLLLVEAAKRISSCTRETDTVARLGGDEFTIILSELRDVASIEQVTTHILSQLAAPYTLGEEIVHASGSIGITLYPRDAADAEGLLKNADQAMYAAKNMGRSSFSYFTPALQEAAQSRLRLINDLRTAIEGDQFVLYYQPIVDLATGGVYKAEALIRWKHPTRGLIGPAEFIPLAEETGLIVKIGDWVFREAVREVQRLRTLYHPVFQISINKSPKQFRDGGSGNLAWLKYLDEQKQAGSSIVVEITEGLLLNVETEVTDKLSAFANAGVQIAIDDFGTGYSSLAYLKRFDIDFLKIDRTFVRDIETDANDMALSQAIIVMAHALDLKVVAEGVETERQLQLLVEAGCDYAQGFLFAKPLPVELFEALLLDKSKHTWCAPRH